MGLEQVTTFAVAVAVAFDPVHFENHPPILRKRSKLVYKGFLEWQRSLLKS